MFDMRTFDRTEDVSKLEGCNTRNVEYRLFSKELELIRRGSETLDFGAGSLRDSFELAKRGYNVTSVDLNPAILSSYQADYDWPTNGTARKIVTGKDLAECLSQIENTLSSTHLNDWCAGWAFLSLPKKFKRPSAARR
jgi:SAM-dependent methyltransferase